MLFSSLLPAALLLSLTPAPPALAASQDAPAGFEALGTDPVVAPLFDQVAVSPGPPARAVARNVQGSAEGTPFVNVVRWVDARRFRGKLVALRQRARLDAPAPDTQARLWVRVVRADGATGFADDGVDQATSSAEWTPLETVGAIASDATDLCFGMLIAGTTPVHIGNFELEVLTDASPADLRHQVPQRWTRDPDVRNARVTDPGRGLDLRVTSFVPPGHPVADLPHLWLLRDGDDLRDTYATGRALLEGMRLGQEPPAIVSLVQVREGALQSGVTAMARGDAFPRLLRTAVDTELGKVAVHSVVVPARDGVTAPFHPAGTGELVPTRSFPEPADLAALAEPGGRLYAERVQLRWARARHDAADDAELASLLFDASLASMEPWAALPAVRMASHSLAGHDCGHDHSHGSGHTHSHD